MIDRLYNLSCRLGKSGIDMMGAMYISLFASLIISLCFNFSYFASWFSIIALLLFLSGFCFALLTTLRFNQYEKKYNDEKTASTKKTLSEYCSERDERKKIQHILIYTLWLPAIALSIYVGFNISANSNQNDKRLKNIDMRTIQIDSILSNTTSLIYKQNLLLLDSIEFNKKIIDIQCKQIDSLNKVLNNKKRIN